MTKQTQPRYTIATITTTDVEMIKQRIEVKKSGITDGEIYKRGLEVIAQEQMTQNNIS